VRDGVGVSTCVRVGSVCVCVVLISFQPQESRHFRGQGGRAWDCIIDVPLLLSTYT